MNIFPDSQLRLSVSDVNRLFNTALEAQFPALSFAAEISEITQAASGHIYMTLKDAEAQLSAVMWRSAASSLKFKPKVGMSVVCDGRPNVYIKSGRLQIVITRMQEDGVGALQRKFLELKEKLDKEGLFESSRKRKLPFLPRAIGIVTSKSGAAISDIMTRLSARMPQLPVYLVDVRVQGDGAALQIAKAISYFNSLSLVDVLIVTRGGGSLEDLWAFNEEVVVRAVFSSRLPVISAVGHERDTTLSDLAADVRAPTPTAAAEIVVPRRVDLLGQIAACERSLLEFDRWLQPLFSELDAKQARLERQLANQVSIKSSELKEVAAQVALIEPGRLLRAHHDRLKLAVSRISVIAGRVEALRSEAQALAYRLGWAGKQSLQLNKSRLDSSASVLKTLNPLGVLARGYSIVRKGSEIIRSSEALKTNDELEVSFAKGQAMVTVKEKKND
jgi:exodeoxyribonuclease VII large subunit